MMANIQNFIQTVSSMQLSDYLDILVVAFLIYSLLPLLRTPNIMKLARTVGVFVLVAWLTGVMKLYTINWILSRLLSIGLLAFVILFQPELRRALEKVGRAKVVKPISLFETVTADETGCMSAINQIALACEKLSRTATGALIVVERQTKLGEQIETGTIIKAVPSEELFRNIFFPNTPLHDGAVIIRDNLVYAAGCFLPKPQKEELINKELGSRHRAAIGMSEVSDAIVIIVSEETGRLSIAIEGQLHYNLTPDEVKIMLLDELSPKKSIVIEEKEEKVDEKNN